MDIVTWPYVKNGLSHPYHLDESILIVGASGVIFNIHYIFYEKHVIKQNSTRYCNVISGAILFAFVIRIGHQAYVGKFMGIIT